MKQGIPRELLALNRRKGANVARIDKSNSSFLIFLSFDMEYIAQQISLYPQIEKDLLEVQSFFENK